MLQKPLHQQQKNCLKETLGRIRETYSVKPKLCNQLESFKKNWPSLNVGRKAALDFIKFNSPMETF